MAMVVEFNGAGKARKEHWETSRRPQNWGCDGTLVSWCDPRRKFLFTVKPQRLKALRSRTVLGTTDF